MSLRVIQLGPLTLRCLICGTIRRIDEMTVHLSLSHSTKFMTLFVANGLWHYETGLRRKLEITLTTPSPLQESQSSSPSRESLEEVGES